MKTTTFYILISFVAFASCQSIGNQLYRTFLTYAALPLAMDDAIDAGWTNSTGCDPNLGIPFVEVSYGPVAHYPITLYFTASGQVTGLGVTHFGEPIESLIKNYWQPSADGNYFMSATFRPASFGICDSSNVDENPLGTQVVINQGSSNIAIPLTEVDATKAEYTEGGSLHTMGTHWSYDLASHPDMSWIAANLQPVVPMYMNGSISAFFFYYNNNSI